MAAMAPALTDAPAEAHHHIRFKLAAPSSSLSPDSSAENNGNAGNILIHHHSSSASAAAKRKASAAAADERSLDFCGGNKNQEQQQQTQSQQDSALGKLQPLVASYLCSDVTPVPPAKESIKLQGVLIKQSVLKSHSILPSSLFNGGGDFLLRKRQTLELSGGQLTSLMSGSPNGGGGGGGQSMAPVNGLAKKLAMSGGCVAAAVNGGKPSASVAESQPQLPPPDSGDLKGTAPPGHVPLKGTPQLTNPTENNIQSSSSLSSHSASSPRHGNAKPDRLLNAECQEAKSSDTPSHPLQADEDEEEEEGGGDEQSHPPTCTPQSPQPQPPSSSSSAAPPSLDSLDAVVRERSLLHASRQGEIEGRLRRLRKRLQVVQAKQVERHLRQQLGGFLDSALSRAPGGGGGASRRADAVAPASATWRTGRHSSSGGAAAGAGGDGGRGLGRFLKGGAVPAELERLCLSGAANLRWAESAVDSDVTESSSGGDSDLEEEELGRADVEQRHVKICKRAESQYMVERAAIISHWNWLQAHISDLEYRIRQQTDVYRQVRSGKGSVELGGLAPSALVVGGVEVKTEAVSSQDGISERLEHKVKSHLSTAESGPWRGESGPWRGQNGRPVNGVLNRVADGCTDLRPGAKPQPAPPDATCVSARTRPLLSCKRRRLLTPNAVPNLNGKAQRSSGVQCLCRVNPCCVTCGGRPAPPSEDPRYELNPLERLSRLDPGVHPILSFTDDVCVGLRLQQVLQTQWSSKALERSRPSKKLSLKHKLSSKDKHKLPSSLLAARLGHSKSRAEKQQRLLQLSGGGGGALGSGRLEAQALCKALSSPAGPYDRGYARKRPREQHHPLDRNGRESPSAFRASPKLFLDSGSPCPSLVSLHSSSVHSPLTRQLSTSSESNTPLGPGGHTVYTPQPIRRRRGESSFDINNIVIPMSVVATTRVEKLQYKEILTPSWREADVFSQPMAEEENEYEMEDLSDAAFTQLHQPCQDQERSRWTWMALAPAQRRGSRSYKSVDGRTTPLLCGTNPPTPQPASPDPGPCPAPPLHDYSCAPSPRSPPGSPDSAPHTPCSQRGDAHLHLHVHLHRPFCSEDTRCSTPDFTFEERTVVPWDRRSFPLSEDPEPEPDPQDQDQDPYPHQDPLDQDPARPRAHSASSSGWPAGFGRLESEETDPSPREDDAHKQKAAAHR